MFESAGVPAADAAVVSRSLVGANLRGHDSHGVMRIAQYLEFLRDGKFKTNVPLEILDESPALLAADAGWGLGQVQAHRLLDHLIEKAKIVGVTAGALRRCGHTGRLGEYAERAVAERLAFIGTVNSHGGGRRVAPPGGIEGRISTNPICIGVPTPNSPLILDFGTSAVAEGKVRVVYQKGERTPDGWLLDAEGKPTTDPSVLYVDPRGSILPMGGAQAYKGFGLGLLLDALAGGLSGGMCSQPGPLAGVGNSVLFVLLDVDRFGGADHFLSEVGNLTDYVRSSPPAKPSDSITLPGDPERIMLEQRQASGIPIPDGVWKILSDWAARTGVAMPI
jgi:uncharacterized oxidoreductase